MAAQCRGLPRHPKAIMRVAQAVTPSPNVPSAPDYPQAPNSIRLFCMRTLAAFLCLTFAVLLFSAGVSWSADYQKGFAAYQSGDYATALREWTPLAEQGVAAAQYNLGVMYRKGQGVPQDDKTAVKWYRLAAKQGLSDWRSGTSITGV